MARLEAAPSEEVATLRRCMRDVAALAAFPALWAGSGTNRIVEGLCEAVMRMCRLDFIYAEVRTHQGASTVSWGRSLGLNGAQSPQALASVLGPWAAAGAPAGELPGLLDLPSTLQAAVLPFGPEISSGFLVAGKCSAGFPTEADRLLLRVGVNQTAIILRRRRAEEEREVLLERETRRAIVLTRVAQASTLINSVLSIESIARILTEEARAIVGAHLAVTSLITSQDWSQAINAVSASEEYAAFRACDLEPDGTGLEAEVCRTNTAMRLTQSQLEAHPAGRGLGAHAARPPSMRGRLAMPLVGHGGKNLGLVQLSDKYEGEFSEQDEAVLRQLAAIASVGIENACLYDSLREQDQRKDEFLATLAHELRNPLAPLRTGLDILRSAKGDSSIASTTQDIMNRQLSHMVRLIDELMDVSRVSRGKIELRRESIGLQRALDAALETSRPLIEAARHTLDVAPADKQLRIDGDLVRLAQVFTNLLNNSAKYTPKGGRIRLSATREGQYAVVRVEDNGVGIPAEMQPKVFDLFTQVGRDADRAQGGLGIGLSLAKKLVEMHGGDIAVQSSGSGKGSTFTVRLPVSRERQVAENDLSSIPPPGLAEHSGTRVLVVDDNTDAAESFSMLLNMLGYEAQLAHSGAEALVLAQQFRPELVFLDLGLPGMSGWEVARQLRANVELSPMCIVAVTGWGTEEDRRRTLEAGFDCHLIKPVDIAAVENVLSGLLQPS